MSRRDNAAVRCARCRMLPWLCVCPLMPAPPLATRTRLTLIVHRDEARKPTNTGQLGAACLANSEVLVRGHADQPSAAWVAPPGTRALLLFPADDAIPLDRLPATSAPTTLIVPDGTWRQAQRVRSRVPGLRDVPCVVLPPGPPTRYRLRSESRPGGLATLEAIARAFAILEGPEVGAMLERVFDAVVERTLWSRGLLASDQVAAGIPAVPA